MTFALNAFVTEVDYASCGPVARQPDSLEDALGPIWLGGAPAVLIETRGSSILPRVLLTGIDELRPHLELTASSSSSTRPSCTRFRAPCSN